MRFNSIASTLFVMVAILFLASCAISAESPVSETIDAMLRAYGGKEKLAAVKTVSAHGTIDDFLRKKSGGYARTMRRPGALRIDIMPEQGGEVRILDGERGLQGSGGTLRAANPVSLSSMRYQYAYLDLPMSLADGNARVVSQQETELNGRRMLLLLVDTEGAPQLRVYVASDTWLIARVEADFSMGGMGSMRLGTEYEDFKPVDGILFPFVLNNFAGKKISVITLKDIEINRPISKDLFPPP